MNIGEIANAMVELATHPKEREQYGETGYRRVTQYYRAEQLYERYGIIYDFVEKKMKRTRAKKEK